MVYPRVLRFRACSVPDLYQICAGHAGQMHGADNQIGWRGAHLFQGLFTAAGVGDLMHTDILQPAGDNALLGTGRFYDHHQQLADLDRFHTRMLSFVHSCLPHLKTTPTYALDCG